MKQILFGMQARHVLCLSTCLLFTGCAMTEKVAKSMVNTQKVVSYQESDYADPTKIVGAHALVYSPRDSGTALLDEYAPILVQEVLNSNDGAYPRDSDEIGTPELKVNDGNAYSVLIDTLQPALYSSVETTRVYGREMQQLVYVFWYPRHPIGMVEKGDIDGGVLRITLDSQQRPAVYEFVGACGCFHGVFVSDRIEQASEAEYKSLVQGKKRFVERDVDNEDDWRVRDVVREGKPGARPVVFLSAGKHQCVAIQSTDSVKNLNRFQSHPYVLEDYSALERLPVHGKPGENASMFDSKGLIWGAQRKGEEKVFSKLDHGGWPRRLSAMKIHWDQESWNDKDLLERFLRLPHSMSEPQAPARKN